MGDTPTSRVRSAAQGYVELTGRGMMPPNTQNKAPLTGIPCTWWRYKIEQRGANRSRSWSAVQSGTSEESFLLDDGTGQCLIDPRGADVFPSTSDVWYGSSEWPDGVRIPSGGGVLGWLLDAVPTGRYRYTEHRLEERGRLCAIGSFRSLGGVSVESPDRAVAELLRGWKQDQASLLARFDMNHDGVISAAEWDRARAAAREQVVAAAGAGTQAPGINVLSKPEDGRAFLLAAFDEQTLARTLRRRAAAGMAGFVASCCALTWMLTRL
ncbi:MAG TPA: GIDE domain-containing protein [Steroidobacteraceae bacterium]|nr:GIDE domain-containing protein [Steroidobacteraceae bacterium]